MDAGLHSLKTVREHASGLRDEAQRALQQAERQLAQAMAQGDTLKDYRRDTAVRWGTPHNRPTGIAHLQSAHHFLARLDTALQQQTQTLQQALALADRRRAELKAAETHVAALDKLITRREQAALAKQQRSEQMANDEYAQRVAASRAEPLDAPSDTEADFPLPTTAPRTALAATAPEFPPCRP